MIFLVVIFSPFYDMYQSSVFLVALHVGKFLVVVFYFFKVCKLQ